MARLTLTDARSVMLKGRPWTFRLECTTGGHNKFWLATGRGQNEPVEVHYGAIGAKAAILVKDWAYIEKTAPEKEAKGYTYVDTPFVRVQPSTIAGVQASPVIPMTPTSRTIPMISASPVVPMVAKPSVVPMVAKPSVVPVVAGDDDDDDDDDDSVSVYAPRPTAPVAPVAPPVVVPSLPAPWNRIMAVQKQGAHWVGLDSTGGTVMAMPKEAARRLVQAHVHITVMGL